VDVLRQSDYGLAGRIDLAPVGATPPDGAVAAEPGGRVLATYTGVVLDQQSQLRPNTVACTLATSTCSTVWSGWGSATAEKLNNASIAVPAWDPQTFTSGKLAFFGGSTLTMVKQVPLSSYVPGAVAMSGDGRYMYWITFPAPGSATIEQELLRVNTTTGAIDATVKFGKRLAYALALDAAGDAVVSILYDRAPVPSTSVGALPQPGVYGAGVQVFSPDLATSRNVPVGQGPAGLAVDGSSLLVASTASKPTSVGLYDLSSGAIRGSTDIPAGWTLDGLHIVTLGDGSAAGILVINQQDGDHFRLGVVNLAGGPVKWYEFSGTAIGSVAA
jgi:hypothetical protein